MKKMLKRAGAVLLTGILLAGCTDTNSGSRGNYEGGGETPDDIQTPETTPEPTISDPEPEPESRGEWADYFANGTVENNGHEMVKVGDRIYYRRYDTKAIERTEIGHDFLGWDNPEYQSDIMYYDINNDNESGYLCTVNGRGPLYATENGFLLDDGNNGSLLVKPDGTIVNNYCSGAPAGVSDDGSLHAARINGNTRSYVELMYGQDEIGGLKQEKDYGSAFLGFAGNAMIASMYDEDAGVTKVYSYDNMAEMKELGEIPKYEGEFYDLSPEFYDFVSSGDDFALAYGYYDGTAHALVSSTIFMGKAGSEGSISPMVTYDEDYYEKSLYTDDAGNILWGDHAPGEVGLSDVSHGDLIYYTGTEDYETAYENFCSIPEEEYYEEDKWEFLQEAFKSGDKIFAVRAGTYRNPSEDFGWRWAYNLQSLDYLMLDLNDMRDTGAVTYFMDFLYSTSWSEFATLDMVQGEWELDWLIVEGDKQVPSEDGTNHYFIVDGETATSIYEWSDGSSETVAQWIADEGVDIEGPTFIVPDDPSEQKFVVVNCTANKLELRVTYIYDGGCLGSWYGYFSRR